MQLRHRPTDAYRLTVAEYLTGWLEGKRRLRASTRESYADYIDRLYTKKLGHLLLRNLEEDPRHVEEFFTWVATQPNRWGHTMSPATVRRVHAVLRGALNTAVRKRLLTFNPVLAVELAEVAKPKITVWTAVQAVQFLHFLGGDPAAGRAPERLRALYYFAVITAMRRGELLGQRDEDLDLPEQITAVAEARVKTRSGVVVNPPKTRSGERSVTYDASTVTVLTEHLARRAADKAAAGPAWVETGLVFVNADGTPLNPDYVSRHFKTLCKQAGVPVIRFKDVRHTSITLGLTAGVAMKVMSERAGHSSSWFTADTYTHVVEEVARDAAERIADVLSLAAARQARTAADAAGRECERARAQDVSAG